MNLDILDFGIGKLALGEDSLYCWKISQLHFPNDKALFLIDE